jgi:hypothetical protein
VMNPRRPKPGKRLQVCGRITGSCNPLTPSPSPALGRGEPKPERVATSEDLRVSRQKLANCGHFEKPGVRTAWPAPLCLVGIHGRIRLDGPYIHSQITS